MAEKKNKDGLYPCCADRSNRTVISITKNPDNANEHEKHERCTSCGRNHYELTVDKVKLGVKVL